MNINIMLVEIWKEEKDWVLGCERIRGLYMLNVFTGVAFYGDTVDAVVRKVWLSIYSNSNVEVIPPSHGMVKG